MSILTTIAPSNTVWFRVANELRDAIRANGTFVDLHPITWRRDERRAARGLSDAEVVVSIRTVVPGIRTSLDQVQTRVSGVVSAMVPEPPEDAPRFDPFQRLDYIVRDVVRAIQTLSDVGRGTRIAEHITIDSVEYHDANEEGDGSAFWFAAVSWTAVIDTTSQDPGSQTGIAPDDVDEFAIEPEAEEIEA